MASEVTQGDYDQLRSRVDVLEHEVEGEKLVTRHILAQTRRNSDDLAAIKSRLDRVEIKVDGLTQEVETLGKVLQDLVRNLPKIVSEAVRQASPARGGKR